MRVFSPPTANHHVVLGMLCQLISKIHKINSKKVSILLT